MIAVMATAVVLMSGGAGTTTPTGWFTTTESGAKYEIASSAYGGLAMTGTGDRGAERPFRGDRAGT